MADIHEEAQFGLAHLLGMDMLLQAQFLLLTGTAVGEVFPDRGSYEKQVDEVSQRAAVPWRMHDDGEGVLGGGDLIALGLDLEHVFAWRQVRERDVVLSGQQPHVGLAVDAVEVGDVLRTVVGERGEADGE